VSKGNQDVISIKKDGEVLLGDVECAFRMLQRMKGLLGRSSLGPGRALWISPCNAIHTFFMSMTIDVIFLDRSMRVVRIIRGVSPWRMAGGGIGAHSVVEIETGWFDWSRIREGDTLECVTGSFGQQSAVKRVV
jgi:uncharacterized protein